MVGALSDLLKHSSLNFNYLSFTQAVEGDSVPSFKRSQTMKGKTLGEAGVLWEALLLNIRCKTTTANITLICKTFLSLSTSIYLPSLFLSLSCSLFFSFFLSLYLSIFISLSFLSLLSLLLILLIFPFTSSSFSLPLSFCFCLSLSQPLYTMHKSSLNIIFKQG